MKLRACVYWLAAAATQVMDSALTSSPAFAVQDSAVKTRAGSGKIGKLRLYMNKDGNNWAPGDWISSVDWRPCQRSFRYETDYLHVGIGGAQ